LLDYIKLAQAIQAALLTGQRIQLAAVRPANLADGMKPMIDEVALRFARFSDCLRVQTSTSACASRNYCRRAVLLLSSHAQAAPTIRPLRLLGTFSPPSVAERA
jgi:hypothetical protein